MAGDPVANIVKALAGLAVKGAVHATADKLTTQLTGTPAMLEHLARAMYEAENRAPWAGLTAADQEVWLRRVKTVLGSVVSMLAPRFAPRRR